jgi:transposase
MFAARSRLELMLQQIKAVEAERGALLATKRAVMPASAVMLHGLKGIGPFAAILWAERLAARFDNRCHLDDNELG